MKKLFITACLAISTVAFADSVTLSYQSVDNLTKADQYRIGMNYSRPLNRNWTGDVNFNNQHTEGTDALSSTRIETGLTYTARSLPLPLYVRAAVGQKFSSSGAFEYYSIEPGVRFPVGPVTVRLGYRWRTSFNPTVNNDQTHTTLLSVRYLVSAHDSVGVGYNRTTGDNQQNVISVNYTRNF